MSANSQSRLVAARYAAALFSFAAEKKSVDAVDADLKRLAALVAENASFAVLTESPLVSRKKAGEALESLLSKAGANPATGQFLATLAANRRLALLGSVAEQYTALVRAGRGEIEAKVQTATALPPAEEKRLAETLARATGKKISLKLSQNPALLAGVVIEFDGKRFDASATGQLERLATTLRQRA